MMAALVWFSCGLVCCVVAVAAAVVVVLVVVVVVVVVAVVAAVKSINVRQQINLVCHSLQHHFHVLHIVG